MLEEKEVLSKMVSLGYSHTATSKNKLKGDTLMFVKPIKELNSHINADIELQAERMELSFCMLKLFIQLHSGKFAWNHPRFKNYEESIIMYAAKCLDFDPLEIIQGLRKVEVVAYTQEVNAPKKELKERRKELWEKVKEVCKKREYTEQLARAFMDYWCQKNEKGTKFLFEITKAKTGVFDVGGRLSTWKKRDEEYNSTKKSFSQERIERQNKQTVAKSHVPKKDMF